MNRWGRTLILVKIFIFRVTSSQASDKAAGRLGAVPIVVEVGGEDEVAFGAGEGDVEEVGDFEAAKLAIGPEGAEGGAANAGGDHGGEAVGHEPGLAGACGCQYEQGAVEVIEDLSLLGVGIGHRIAGIGGSESG